MRRITVILLAAAVLGWFAWSLGSLAEGKILDRNSVIEEACK